MTYFTGSESAEKLIEIALDLMKTERDAITSGSFETVYDLTQDKLDLLQAIEDRFTEISAQERTASVVERRSKLQELASKLRQNALSNQKLLRAVQDGVEKARIEVEGHAPNREAIFYAPNGGKISVGGSAAGTIRKV